MTDHDVDSDLVALEHRRELLASVLGIVRFMEDLQQSLEAVQVLGDTSRLVPEFARRKYDELDSGFTGADNSKLREYLDSLEDLVKQDLTRVLRIAGADRRAGQRPGDPPPLEPPQADQTLIEEFRRRALTLVALRILMRKRGQPVEAVALPVPEALLEETLDRLDHERCAHRERALGEAISMAEDVRAQLRKPDASPAMRRMLEAMRDGLQLNIEHLQSGKPVAELPVPMESAEIGAVAWGGSKTARVEEAPGASGGQDGAEVAGGQGGTPPGPADHEPEPVPRRGVLERVWIYLTTPPEVNWRRTATYRRPQKK